MTDYASMTREEFLLEMKEEALKLTHKIFVEDLQKPSFLTTSNIILGSPFFNNLVNGRNEFLCCFYFLRNIDCHVTEYLNNRYGTGAPLVNNSKFWSFYSNFENRQIKILFFSVDHFIKTGLESVYDIMEGDYNSKSVFYYQTRFEKIRYNEHGYKFVRGIK